MIDIIIVLLTHAIRWLRLYRCLEVLLSLKAICLIIKRRCSILLRLRIVTKSLLSRCSLLLYLIIDYSLKLLLWSIILRCKLILWGCLCLPLIISILVLYLTSKLLRRLWLIRHTKFVVIKTWTKSWILISLKSWTNITSWLLNSYLWSCVYLCWNYCL